MNNRVIIKGEENENDGLSINMGPVNGSWYDISLPPCPDCGGDVVWFEAGYVPGTRKCVGKINNNGRYAIDGGCGSFFSVAVHDNHVYLERQIFQMV